MKVFLSIIAILGISAFLSGLNEAINLPYYGLIGGAIFSGVLLAACTND